MKTRSAKLIEASLPDFGEPVFEPVLGKDIYIPRMTALRARMRDQGYDAVVIYGDREHVGNICWATGFDPRFEEAILIVSPLTRPHLLLGNECYPYSETASGIFTPVLWPPLSLMGQPRQGTRPLLELLVDAGLKRDMRIGLAGWKGYEDVEGSMDGNWLEAPHYLVEELKKFGQVTNAAMLFMSPKDGLRAINEADQLARFEFAACRTSNAVKRVIHAARPGISEYVLCRNLGFDGFPLSIHVSMCSGPRAKYGLPSPSARTIEYGDPIVVGTGLVGALNCRAGFLVASENDLPPPIGDYVDKLVRPYFEAAVAWYETIGIGVTGGELYDTVMSRLGDPFFGVGLNPGHLIHLEEWLHSPIRKGSIQKLRSGMALQCDIIPATNTPYFTSNIEDGIALADEALRTEIANRFPEMWSRVERRRAFMIEVLGISLKPEVLPFSNIPAWLPPFWLSPGRFLAMK
ncbi:MAG: hypothetical protein HC855_16225 [Rhizobiales bacterium]|nr:hypothetical protein [Hyphomicrobiales bacterium]